MGGVPTDQDAHTLPINTPFQMPETPIRPLVLADSQNSLPDKNIDTRSYPSICPQEGLQALL